MLSSGEARQQRIWEVPPRSGKPDPGPTDVSFEGCPPFDGEAAHVEPEGCSRKPDGRRLSAGDGGAARVEAEGCLPKPRRSPKAEGCAPVDGEAAPVDGVHGVVRRCASESEASERKREGATLSRIVAERDRKEEVTYVSQLVRYALLFSRNA